MTTASDRATAVAEILWQLKRAERLATLSSIAERAEFSPGSDCRTVRSCLANVRRDWPHLQWWRAVADDGVLDEEQQLHLVQANFELETADSGSVVVKSLADHLMTWEVADNVQDEGESPEDV